MKKNIYIHIPMCCIKTWLSQMRKDKAPELLDDKISDNLKKVQLDGKSHSNKVKNYFEIGLEKTIPDDIVQYILEDKTKTQLFEPKLINKNNSSFSDVWPLLLATYFDYAKKTYDMHWGSYEPSDMEKAECSVFHGQWCTLHSMYKLEGFVPSFDQFMDIHQPGTYTTTDSRNITDSTGAGIFKRATQYIAARSIAHKKNRESYVWSQSKSLDDLNPVEIGGITYYTTVPPDKLKYFDHNLKKNNLANFRIMFENLLDDYDRSVKHRSNIYWDASKRDRITFDDFFVEKEKWKVLCKLFKEDGMISKNYKYAMKVEETIKASKNNFQAIFKEEKRQLACDGRRLLWHQFIVSKLCHPLSLKKVFLSYRTGSGKTMCMSRALENWYAYPCHKLVIVPTHDTKTNLITDLWECNGRYRKQLNVLSQMRELMGKAPITLKTLTMSNEVIKTTPKGKKPVITPDRFNKYINYADLNQNDNPDEKFSMDTYMENLHSDTMGLRTIIMTFNELDAAYGSVTNTHVLAKHKYEHLFNNGELDLTNKFLIFDEAHYITWSTLRNSVGNVPKNWETALKNIIGTIRSCKGCVMASATISERYDDANLQAQLQNWTTLLEIEVLPMLSYFGEYPTIKKEDIEFVSCESDFYDEFFASEWLTTRDCTFRWTYHLPSVGGPDAKFNPYYTRGLTQANKEGKCQELFKSERFKKGKDKYGVYRHKTFKALLDKEEEVWKPLVPKLWQVVQRILKADGSPQPKNEKQAVIGHYHLDGIRYLQYILEKYNVNYVTVDTSEKVLGDNSKRTNYRQWKEKLENVLPKDKNKCLAKWFNEQEQIKVHVMLIVGAPENLNVLGTHTIHLLEPYAETGDFMQAIGRINRMCDPHSLKVEDRRSSRSQTHNSYHDIQPNKIYAYYMASTENEYYSRMVGNKDSELKKYQQYVKFIQEVSINDVSVKDMITFK